MADETKKPHEKAWKKFLSLRRTLFAENRDFAEWRKGRRQYAVWTIDVRNPSVQSRFDAARTHLSEFLLEPYRRQPHVSLFVCGFLAGFTHFDDDYSAAGLECHLRDLKKAAPAPFTIEVGGINSFAAAPFLEVFDVAGGIKKVRKVLSRTHSEIRAEDYLPHLTLGLYADRFDTKMVAEKMASFRPASPVSCFVDAVSLTTYSAPEIAGPLTIQHTIGLGD
ncbi:MAG: 2'-5' RNA ligase family protein [Desulfosalsimonadaceae bacterium]